MKFPTVFKKRLLNCSTYLILRNPVVFEIHETDVAEGIVNLLSQQMNSFFLHREFGSLSLETQAGEIHDRDMGAWGSSVGLIQHCLLSLSNAVV